ncbi:hypothetical protein B0J17DRAFT_716171 [Rhizoctonia solani]|nr:hypothetical protein B0J17DRAFT_716171 [Rhizoctonia solani]
MAAPPDQTSVIPTATSADEGDIYDDVEISPLTKATDLLGDQPSENVPPVNQPPRRVIILTTYPPTFKGTAVFGHGPAIAEQTKEAAVVLQDRQCWAVDSKHGDGVIGDSLLVEAEKLDTEMFETPSFGHDNGLTADSYRPSGVALWAFGYTEWSCDTEYEAPVTMSPASDPKGKKPEAAEQSVSSSSPCPQCNRVPALIRIVSNQRGQQWELNPVPYVDVPPTWRAFDEALVVDV